jgi:hypothetical protein
MDHSSAPERKMIRPIDAGVEWAIKGANIGLFVGYFSAKLDTPSGPNYSLKFVGNVATTMFVTGGVLGTWMMIVRSM